MNTAAIAWLWNERKKMRFTQAHIRALREGLKPHVLQNWANRGLAETLNRNPGKAGTREYDFDQLLSILIAFDLSDFGLSPSVAFRVASKFPERMRLAFKKANRPMSAQNIYKSMLAILKERPHPWEAAVWFKDEAALKPPVGCCVFLYPIGEELEQIAVKLAQLFRVDLRQYVLDFEKRREAV